MSLMNPKQRLQLERQYHESEDKARGDSSLVRGVYSSGLFDEAERYHQDALGDVRGARVLDYGCGGGWSAAKLRSCLKSQWRARRRSSRRVMAM